jgi:hypothetical protein
MADRIAMVTMHCGKCGETGCVDLVPFLPDEEMKREITSLRDRNAKLEVIAEAARAYLRTWESDGATEPAQDPLHARYVLQQTLQALGSES